MTIDNQPATPSDPVESDAKIVVDAGIDLGQQRERELKDEREKGEIAARTHVLEEQLAQENAKASAVTADETETQAREAADKKAISDAADRLNHGATPGPGPAPQPPRPRVG